MSSARITALEAEVAGLRKALVSRTVIGQATGILMERFDMPADRAFSVLSRMSQQKNVKLIVLNISANDLGFSDHVIDCTVAWTLGYLCNPQEQAEIVETAFSI